MEKISVNSAVEAVNRLLAERATPGDEWIIVEAETIERDFGWVFFYNSKRFIETGDFIYRLAGNGPVIFNKHTGAVEFYGSALPLQDMK